MIKLISTTYKSLVSITDLFSSVLSFGSSEAKRYIAETSEVNSELRESINLRKVEAILSKMEDVSEMDIPAPAKESATAKLQALLDAELTTTSAKK